MSLMKKMKKKSQWCRLRLRGSQRKKREKRDLVQCLGSCGQKRKQRQGQQRFVVVVQLRSVRWSGVQLCEERSCSACCCHLQPCGKLGPAWETQSGQCPTLVAVTWVLVLLFVGEGEGVVVFVRFLCFCARVFERWTAKTQKEKKKRRKGWLGSLLLFLFQRGS